MSICNQSKEISSQQDASAIERLATRYLPDSKRVRSMFGSIAVRYDLTNSILSMGIHTIWRRVLINMIPSSSDALVLDLCTGTADLVPLLQKRFGKVLGVDFCMPMLDIGKQKLDQSSLSNPNALGLVQGDALCLPFADDSFDIVSIAFGVRNFENLEAGLREVRRVLRADGKVLILEFGQPSQKVWGAIYSAYSRWGIPLIGAILTGNREAYTYLPETSRNFPCGKALEGVFLETGFCPVKTRPLTGGIAYAYLATAS